MSYSATILADSPVAYWRCGSMSGNILTDSSGNGHNLGLSATGLALTTGLIAGDSDQAILFSGGFAETTDAALVAPKSVEAWVNWNGATASLPTIYNTTSGSFNQGIWIRLSSGTLQFYIYSGGFRGPATVSLTANTTAYICCTYDGSALRVYKNGALASTVSYTGTIGSAGAKTDIGQASGNFFGGVLDEIAIYSTPLTLTQINTHYNAGITAAASGSPRILGAGGHVIGPGAAGGVPRIVFGGNRRMGAGV